jgi:glycolate oxidase iron-sulfur subunit
MEGLFPTNRATERCWSAAATARSATGQQCCGALHAHAGDEAGAQALARHNIAAFEQSGADWIAVNAAGCGAMMKDYGHLLRDDPAWAERAAQVSARVRDVSELLVVTGPAPGGRLPLRVTYDAPCHLHHAQRITDAPLAILRAIPGLDLRCWMDAGLPQGSRDLNPPPDMATGLLQPKPITSVSGAFSANGNPDACTIGAGPFTRMRRCGSTGSPELFTAHRVRPA